MHPSRPDCKPSERGTDRIASADRVVVARVMGCYFTKPARALWSATPSPTRIASKIASSLGVSPTSARPPSPTSPLDGWEPKRRFRRPRALPVGDAVTCKCRKRERVEVGTNAYVETFVASGCEDCVFVVPCAVGAVTVSDCARSACFSWDRRGRAARVRECVDVTYACVGVDGVNGGRVTFEECRDVRARVRVIGKEEEGGTVRFERCGDACARGEMNAWYEDAGEQMRALGFEDEDAIERLEERRDATTFDEAGVA